MKRYLLPSFLLCLVFLNSCGWRKVSQKKYYQFSFYRTYDIQQDSINFEVKNPLYCPLRVNINIQEEASKKDFTLWLKPKQDTLFSMVNSYKTDPKITFRSSFSTLEESDLDDIRLSLPLKVNKRYKINQGYNGGFSHQSDYSKYAIDFNLQRGDTIYCAANGRVVGVIKDYDNDGGGRKLRDQANFITVYHQDLQLFTQYVHLIHQGSLVKLGDSVRSGQPIALSGNTGFTAGPHLHFNALKASVNNGLKSVPVSFETGISGFDLKKGLYIVRKAPK